MGSKGNTRIVSLILLQIDCNVIEEDCTFLCRGGKKQIDSKFIKKGSHMVVMASNYLQYTLKVYFIENNLN